MSDKEESEIEESEHGSDSDIEESSSGSESDGSDGSSNGSSNEESNEESDKPVSSDDLPLPEPPEPIEFDDNGDDFPMPKPPEPITPVESEEDMPMPEPPFSLEDIVSPKTESTEPVDEKVNLVEPFVNRKSFPLAFWYLKPTKEEKAPDSEFLERIQKSLREVLAQLFVLEDDGLTDIYIIRGNREKDRLRIICPDVSVNFQGALDVRSLLLQELGYKVSARVIPHALYIYQAVPTMFIDRYMDLGLGNTESPQSFTCYFHTEIKTEVLEQKMLKWGSTSKPLTENSERYIEYQEIRKREGDGTEDDYAEPQHERAEDNIPFDVLLKGTDEIGFSLGKIPPEIKKKIGKEIDKCLEWFRDKKRHPDTKLNWIRSIKEDLYLLDFTKSKHKCLLCNLVHKSNRQYLVYSAKSKKAFYHCHDSDASQKSVIVSFQKRHQRRKK
jgi:hypothetical protein